MLMLLWKKLFGSLVCILLDVIFIDFLTLKENKSIQFLVKKVFNLKKSRYEIPKPVNNALRWFDVLVDILIGFGDIDNLHRIFYWQPHIPRTPDTAVAAGVCLHGFGRSHIGFSGCGYCLGSPNTVSVSLWVWMGGDTVVSYLNFLQNFLGNQRLFEDEIQLLLRIVLDVKQPYGFTVRLCFFHKVDRWPWACPPFTSP